MSLGRLLGASPGKNAVESFHFNGGQGDTPLGLPPLLGERGGHHRNLKKFEVPDVVLPLPLSEMNSGYPTFFC